MLSRAFLAFQSLSIRWKLQIAFFTLTVITTVFNRWLASNELQDMIAVARDHNVSDNVIQELEAQHSQFIVSSVTGSALEFAIQFVVIFFIAGLFVRPIKALCKALTAVENGDLTQGVEKRSHDEIGVLETSFNNMLARLNTIMREINESGRHMGQSAYQIVALSNEIADIGKKEETRSQEVNEATRELQSVSNSVCELAEGAMAQAKATAEQAQQGIDSVQSNMDTMKATKSEVTDVSERVEELNKATQTIYGIVDSIATIADQTNLLALNAAIEAARAGDQGRGFAVVADEVRSLAARTTHSSSEISEIISSLGQKMEKATAGMNSVVEKVEEAQNRAEATAEVIRSMDKHVGETAQANTRISDSSRQQVEQLNALQQSLDQFFETLNQNSLKVENTANIGDSMFQLTERMNHIMDGFRFNDEAQPVPRAEDEKRTSPRVRNHLLLRIEQNGRHYEGISHDLSMNGIRLVVKQQLSKDSPLAIKLFLPYEDIEQYRNQTPVSLTGKIVREETQQEQQVYGIEFQNLNSQQQEDLNYCFEFFKAAPRFS